MSWATRKNPDGTSEQYWVPEPETLPDGTLKYGTAGTSARVGSDRNAFTGSQGDRKEHGPGAPQQSTGDTIAEGLGLKAPEMEFVPRDLNTQTGQVDGLSGYLASGLKQTQASRDAAARYAEQAGQVGPVLNTSYQAYDYAKAREAGAPVDVYDAGWARQQSDLASKLQAQAEGRGGPSLAQMQMQQGTDRNLNAALAMAASQRGRGSGAFREAGRQRAMATQQGASDSAMLRLQEQQGAQNMLGQVLTGARGQAQSKMGLEQQLALANASSQNQMTLANQQASNEAARSTMQLNAQIGMSNRDASLETSLAQQRAAEQREQYYMGQVLGLGMTEADREMKLAMYNQQMALDAERTRLGLEAGANKATGEFTGGMVNAAAAAMTSGASMGGSSGGGAKK